MTAASDRIRYQMYRVANQKDVLKQRKDSQAKPPSRIPAANTFDPDVQPFYSFEAKVLESFHTGGTVMNQINIARYVMGDIQNCYGVVMLRMYDSGRSFRLYFRGTTPCDTSEPYETDDFQCVQEILSAKVPIVHSDETSKQLTILCQWKSLFGYIPDIAVGIPISFVDGSIGAIVGLAFRKKLPKGFMERKLPQVQESLAVLIPYALNNQGIADSREDISRINRVLESIETIEKAIETDTTSDIALTQIGAEISNLANCKNIVMFTVDTGDNMLRKFYTYFGTSGRTHCPSKEIHSLADIPFSNRHIPELAWVVAHKKGMKINRPSDLLEFRIDSKIVHSIGNCISKSMIIVPIIDYSGELTLVIELSDKDRTFTLKEFEMVLLFCQHTACLLTCTVLMDRRERNYRRRNIINEMLCNISFIKHDNVEKFITHHRKTSKVFRGGFDEFHLCIRCFPENDIAGIALEIFYEMNIVNDFKIRRAVLIRFILSVQQGYGQLPYHNWYHAVSVAHYSYLLVRRLRLVEQGHLTKLEAFALVVSALTHDIDHRGTNNQFQSYTNSDIYKLYACEDSCMERHHLAIALAILHREDCNILESFNDTDYKQFVELLTWNIIATDISKHLKNRQTIFADAKSANSRQRKMARLSLFMTAADLCDNCKKWDDNLPTVKGILQEFFSQGDMERQLGVTPVSMMDRRVAYVPVIEYKFVKYIVKPVYRFLAEIYTELQPCLKVIEDNENYWTMATVVFDANKAKMDQLDILDLPAMKEEQLLQIKFDEPLDSVKQRKFSLVVPSSVTTNASEKKYTTAAIPAAAAQPEEVLPDDLEEVDTGEKSKRCRWCSVFLCCCRRHDDSL